MPQEAYAGPMFLNAEWPYVNALTSGVTGQPPSAVYGTDPVDYARDTLSAWDEQAAANLIPRYRAAPGTLPSFLPSGKSVAGFLVALLVLAFGLWVLVKQ
jgi:hypothetical protein